MSLSSLLCFYFWDLIDRTAAPSSGKEPNHGNAVPNVEHSETVWIFLAGMNTCSGAVERQYQSLRDPVTRSENASVRRCEFGCRHEDSRGFSPDLTCFTASQPDPRSRNPICLLRARMSRHPGRHSSGQFLGGQLPGSSPRCVWYAGMELDFVT